MEFYAISIGIGEEDYGGLTVEAASHDEAVQSLDVDSFIAEQVERTGLADLCVTFARPVVRWVNAYNIDRCYGGPEEGGWYYDYYQCVASVPVQNSKDVEVAKELLNRTLGHEDEPAGLGRYSVIGHPDFRVYEEDDKAESETQQRPHYE